LLHISLHLGRFAHERQYESTKQKTTKQQQKGRLKLKIEIIVEKKHERRTKGSQHNYTENIRLNFALKQDILCVTRYNLAYSSLPHAKGWLRIASPED